MKSIKFLPVLLALCLVAFQSCVKEDFDQPPGAVVSDLVANTTIDALKTMIVDEFIEVNEDLIIEGIVTSDDAAGNIFKQIYIQDATGGAVISIDANNMSSFFPIGQQLFVKLNGLAVQDNDGVLTIGGSIDNSSNFPSVTRMPQLFADIHLEKGTSNNVVTPTSVSLGELTNGSKEDLLNVLVELSDVQFANGYAGTSYADGLSDPPVSVNTLIENCDGTQIIMRNSGYSSFANEITPTGKGTVLALFSKFGGDYQLFIRDQNDVTMDDARCGETVSELEANTTIAQLWDMHTNGNFEAVTEDLVIEAMVSSSDQSGNFFKELFIQDATGGVQLIMDKFDIFLDFPVGQSVFVKMNGLTLGDDNGALTIGGGVEDNNGTDRLARMTESQVNQFVERGAAGNLSPTVVNIADIDDRYLNQLIRLNDVQFTDADSGQSYADISNLFSLNRTVEDCENTIVLRTSGYADFAGSNTATGKGSVTAVLNVFEGTYQLFIRNLNDVDMTETRCDGTTGGGPGGPDPSGAEIAESFDGTVQYEAINLDGWYNIAAVGSNDERWIGNEFDGNKYADASAYNSVDPELDLWLITPSIELDEMKTIEFLSNQHHWVDGNGQFSVWISNDFDGSDVESANWEEVNCNLPTGSNDWYEWVNSGVITLNDYFSSGEVFVGFRYEGTAADDVTGFQLDDVTVKGQ